MIEPSYEQLLVLLQSIAKGDQQAMRNLYDVYSPRVFAYAFHQVGDRSAAEEVVVDTLHEVWKHPLRFRGESRFSTWLIGIARHKVLMKLRRPSLFTQELEDEHAGEADEALQGIADEQREQGVKHCMDKLAAVFRECLHLVFYQGWSLEEVAAAQQCPENTVKTRLFHAKRKIKICLANFLRREQ